MSWKAALLRGTRAFLSSGLRGRGAAALIGGLASLAGPRRDVALQNLARAFPDRDASWRKAQMRRIYHHLALGLVECQVIQKDPTQVLGWIESVSGLDHLDRALDQGRGVVMLTGHIGNWELLGAWLCQKGYPMYAVVQRNEDPETEALIEESRRRIGLKTLSKSFGLRGVVKALRQGAVVGLLADQHGGELTVDFMGHPARTFTGPAVFSLLAGAPIVPVVSFRRAPFRHEVVALPPLALPRGDRDAQIEALTVEVNELLEGLVRRHPEQWLWLHRRWR